MSRPKGVLVVGGAGYIGAHMVRALLAARERVVVFDNLSTGRRGFVPRGAAFVKGDLRNPADLERAFRAHPIDAVMHFAAASLVGESVADPLKYYENNIVGCVHLLKAMRRRGVRRFVFSSTAALYGEPKRVPIRETDPTLPINPYGRTKLAVEGLLADLARLGELSYAALRYFNACGAHASGAIGESHEPETHLIPNVLRAASGRRRDITVFGDDYPTKDGTCVRDYVHVEDLADAHLLALRRLRNGSKSAVFNLGLGKGFSVRQVIDAAQRVTGRRLRVRIGPRRPGDPAVLVASPAKARRELGWKPRRNLEAILRSAWAWEQKEAR